MRSSKALWVCVTVAALLALGAAAEATTIVWVTENTDASNPPSPDDVGFTDLLTAEGYDVVRRNMTVLDAGKIAEMEAADLVMVSRDASSGSYTQSGEVAAWNGLSTPVMLLNQYLVRRNRWKWLNTTSYPGTGDGVLEVTDPGHPIFQGVTLAVDDLVDIATSTTPAGGTSDPGNGLLLAVDPDNGNIAIVSWYPGQEYYAGSGQTAGGYRMFFGAGLDGNNPKGGYNLTADGETIFLNAVGYMTTIPEPASLALLGLGLAALARRRRRVGA